MGWWKHRFMINSQKGDSLNGGSKYAYRKFVHWIKILVKILSKMLEWFSWVNLNLLITSASGLHLKRVDFSAWERYAINPTFLQYIQMGGGSLHWPNGAAVWHMLALTASAWWKGAGASWEGWLITVGVKLWQDCPPSHGVWGRGLAVPYHTNGVWCRG